MPDKKETEANKYVYTSFSYENKLVLKKELINYDEDLLKMLDNELYIWQKIKELSFVPKVLFFNNKNPYYIIYEYIDGVTLNNYKFDNLNEKIDVFIKIIEKVEMLHNRFIVHCDLKPSNILISNNKNIYIIDYGIAQFIGGKTDYGSVSYCSIEQLRKEKVTYNFDIYALGIILYEIITNKKAFNYNNLNELINEKKSDNLLISDVIDDISDNLEIIFYKMINSRYNNVTEAKNDLILWKNNN